MAGEYALSTIFLDIPNSNLEVFLCQGYRLIVGLTYGVDITRGDRSVNLVK